MRKKLKKRKLVCCLLSVMTMPVHLHLAFALSRPCCSTSKHCSF